MSRTLLHIVADWPGHFPNGAQTVAILVAAGADVSARVVHPGPHGSPETALHWAASSDDVAVLDALVDGGADIEAQGAVFTGGTPMSDAVVFGQWRAARKLQPTADHLLDHGADLNWVEHDGKTPCDVAQESGDDNLIQWLRARGARCAAELT